MTNKDAIEWHECGDMFYTLKETNGWGDGKPRECNSRMIVVSGDDVGDTKKIIRKALQTQSAPEDRTTYEATVLETGEKVTMAMPTREDMGMAQPQMLKTPAKVNTPKDRVKSVNIPEGYALIPLEHTPEILEAMEEQYMPFGEMSAAYDAVIFTATPPTKETP